MNSLFAAKTVSIESSENLTLQRIDGTNYIDATALVQQFYQQTDAGAKKRPVWQLIQTIGSDNEYKKAAARFNRLAKYGGLDRRVLSHVLEKSKKAVYMDDAKALLSIKAEIKFQVMCVAIRATTGRRATSYYLEIGMASILAASLSPKYEAKVHDLFLRYQSNKAQVISQATEEMANESAASVHVEMSARPGATAVGKITTVSTDIPEDHPVRQEFEKKISDLERRVEQDAHVINGLRAKLERLERIVGSRERRDDQVIDRLLGTDSGRSLIDYAVGIMGDKLQSMAKSKVGVICRKYMEEHHGQAISTIKKDYEVALRGSRAAMENQLSNVADRCVERIHARNLVALKKVADGIHSRVEAVVESTGRQLKEVNTKLNKIDHAAGVAQMTSIEVAKEQKTIATNLEGLKEAITEHTEMACRGSLFCDVPIKTLAIHQADSSMIPEGGRLREMQLQNFFVGDFHLCSLEKGDRKIVQEFLLGSLKRLHSAIGTPKRGTTWANNVNPMVKWLRDNLPALLVGHTEPLDVATNDIHYCVAETFKEFKAALMYSIRTAKVNCNCKRRSNHCVYWSGVMALVKGINKSLITIGATPIDLSGF